MKAREFLNMPAVINMEIMCARIELEHYKRLAGQMQNTLVDNDRTRLLLLDAKEKIKEQEKLLEEKYISLNEIYLEEMPFISLYFDNLFILSNKNLKGDLQGNWYNLFYNIDNWYKVDEN